MKTVESKTPLALRQVWEWKDACWRDVAGLDLDAAVRESLKRANETTRALGLLPPKTTSQGGPLEQGHT